MREVKFFYFLSELFSKKLSNINHFILKLILIKLILTKSIQSKINFRKVKPNMAVIILNYKFMVISAINIRSVVDTWEMLLVDLKGETQSQLRFHSHLLCYFALPNSEIPNANSQFPTLTLNPNPLRWNSPRRRVLLRFHHQVRFPSPPQKSSSSSLNE